MKRLSIYYGHIITIIVYFVDVYLSVNSRRDSIFIKLKKKDSLLKIQFKDFQVKELPLYRLQ